MGNPVKFRSGTATVWSWETKAEPGYQPGEFV